MIALNGNKVLSNIDLLKLDLAQAAKHTEEMIDCSTKHTKEKIIKKKTYL